MWCKSRRLKKTIWSRRRYRSSGSGGRRACRNGRGQTSSGSSRSNASWTPCALPRYVFNYQTRKIRPEPYSIHAAPWIQTPEPTSQRVQHYRGTSLIRNCLLLGPYRRPKPGALRWSSTLPRYRGTSLIRNCLLLGPYSRPLPRALRWSSALQRCLRVGGWGFGVEV